MRVSGVIPTVGELPLCPLCSARVIPAFTGRRTGPGNLHTVLVDPQQSNVGTVVLCFEIDGLGNPVSGRQLVVGLPADHSGPRWVLHDAVCPRMPEWRRREAWAGLR